MARVCRDLLRLHEDAEAQKTSAFIALANSNSSVADSDSDVMEWKSSRRPLFQSRFAKIGLSLATASLLAGLGIFQIPSNANADRHGTKIQAATIIAKQQYVGKGGQNTAIETPQTLIAKNILEKQDVKNTARLSEAKTEKDEPRIITLNLTSMPTGAQVRDVGNDVVLGITPFTIQISQDKREVVYAFQKAGFLAVTKKFTNQGASNLDATLEVTLPASTPTAPSKASPKTKPASLSPFVAKVTLPSAVTSFKAPKKTKPKIKRAKSASSPQSKRKKIKTATNKNPKNSKQKPQIKKAPKDQRAIIDPFAEE